MQKLITVVLAALLAAGACGAALAADDSSKDRGAPSRDARTAGKPESPERGGDAGGKPSADEARKNPQPQSSVTHHQFAAGKLKFDYTATAGTLVIRDDADKPIATMGYVAYVRDGVDRTRRPVVFAFNGGPGSSSLWLHMGVLGPKRVVAVDAGPTPPAPYPVVDNPYGVLDVADLVMVDAIGTGISQAAGDKKDEDFWGMDADLDSFGRFVTQYVGANDRWNSPKYLLGESYGSTRAAGLVHWLQQKRSMAFNGVVLVSVALDVEALFAFGGNERPFPLYLPAFAVTAQRHGMLPGGERPREQLVEDARRFAYGPYLQALMKGDSLGDAERDAVAEKLHEFTGLSVDYLKAANLRVTEGMFEHELLKARRQTVGRLDSRFLGVTIDPLVKEAEYDPQSSAISSAYASAFNDWWRRELKFGADRHYKPLNFEVFGKWKWDHQVEDFKQPYGNTGPDLKHALVENPGLKVLVMNGWYDLATPFSATEYMIDHLGLPPGFRDRIAMKYYEGGHMMYVNPVALEQMKRDLDAFFAATSH
jgi:carboxypeptidase C (cathepsin A)